VIALKLAVIGDPVAHSRSPELHRGFLAAAGLAGTYDAIRVAAGGCADALRELRAAGYHGLNVTTPLKEEAAAACGSLDATALAVGSVNTVIFAPKATVGANTDGVGLVAALRAARGGASLVDTRVLLLGAGPTARAAAHALAAAGAELAFWNRTAARAEELARRYGGGVFASGAAAEVAVSTLPPGAIPPADVVATLAAAGLVLDANYGPRATLGGLLQRPVLDGSGMLAAQAAASFAMWRRRFVP